MNEVRKSEFAGAMPDFGGPFVQASSDATRRLCEQGQSVAKTISEWNTEVSHFLSHRVAQNGEILGRMTKCQNFPEVFAIQSEWVRDAAEDYLREISKLMEVNSRIVGSLMGSIGQVGMPSAAEMPTSPEVRLGPETRFQPTARSSPARSTAKAED